MSTLKFLFSPRVVLIFVHSGGAWGAPTIRQDDDWTSLKGQLSKTKAAVDTLQVVISLKDLEPYKNHKRVSLLI